MDSNEWEIKRSRPYTELGINKKKCIRCGNPATAQWQICADKNNYRPICNECDSKLNRLVLKFMRHPHWTQKADEYEERKCE